MEKNITFTAGDDFAVEILRDLITQGYDGEKLVDAFVERRDKIRDAYVKFIREADEIALGRREYAVMADVFGD